MYRIAMNTCIDKTRKKRLKLVEFDDKVAEKPELKDDPQKALESQAMQRHIDQALKKLPPRQRMIFIMRHYNELLLKEIAEALQISEGTVKAQLFRAIQKLQKELAFLKRGKVNTNEAL